MDPHVVGDFGGNLGNLRAIRGMAERPEERRSPAGNGRQRPGAPATSSAPGGHGPPGEAVQIPAIGLAGGKLALAVVLMVAYGALNNVGIGSYAPTMATVYALGLNPAVAFPVMMGACTFSVPVGASEFVRLGQYGRKITLFSSIFGIAGVLAAVFIVKSLNVSMLQWVVAAVVLYSGASLLKSALATPAVKQEA